MGGVLINLVGDQPIPNLIPIMHLAPESVYLVASARTERKARNLARAMEKVPSLASLAVERPPLVDAYDLAEIERDLEAMLDRLGAPEREVCLNLTGGTKIMSLAAYNVGRRRNLPMVYLITERPLQLQHYHGPKLVTSETIRAVVPVEVYLESYGFQMTCKPLPAEVTKPNSVWVQAAEQLAQEAVACQDLLALFRQNQPRSATPPVFRLPGATERERALLDHLERGGLIELLRESDAGADAAFRVSSPDVLAFLKSGWLELYAYLAASGPTTAIDDRALNVYVWLREDSGRELTEREVIRDNNNELDLIVSQNGRIAVVSCKAGGPHRDHIDQLASVVSQVLLGTYARKVLVYGVPRYSRARAHERARQPGRRPGRGAKQFFSDELARHARRDAVTVVCAEELPELATILAKQSS